jgi:hypothetical protein
MNAQSPRRTFTASDAMEARKNETLPLLIGLAGPSGSGKTYSALRIATGIQSVVGGDIFVIDTEQRRSLHYADSFRFKHMPFGAPFASLDYLEALRAAKKQGAGVVVIDSCSHEHDGPGGLLEQHENELQRMAGDDWRKRDQMTMLAWQKPKAGRRALIAALTSELDLPAIFCFRAKTTTKPMKIDGKLKPVDMGFTTIGADEWLFEMALSCLLLPGSNGIPTWASDKPGEKLAIKVPRQFRHLSEPPPRPLDENVGIMLAKWAKGDAVKAQPKAERFAAHDASPDRSPQAASSQAGTSDATQHGAGAGAAPNVEDDAEWQEWAAAYIARIKVADRAKLATMATRQADSMEHVAEHFPDLHRDVLAAIAERNTVLDGAE